MPRMRMLVSGLPRELEIAAEDDVVRQSRFTARERVVPAHAESEPVDRRLELQPVACAAVWVGDRLGDGAPQLHRLGVSLDGDVTLDRQLASAALDRSRYERELGVALGVEEVRRLEVCFEVRILDLDGCDLCRSPEYAVGDAHVEVRERTGEGACHVLDRKA